MNRKIRQLAARRADARPIALARPTVTPAAFATSPLGLLLLAAFALLLIALMTGCAPGATSPALPTLPAGITPPIGPAETVVLPTLQAISTPVAAPSTTPSGTTPSGKSVNSYNDLVAALKAAGATVQESGEIDQPAIPVKGKQISVDGEMVQVFEFADNAAMLDVASKISGEGGSIGTTMMTWVAAPHFYRSGKVIVLYVGTNASTTKTLESVLGPQFAGR